MEIETFMSEVESIEKVGEPTLKMRQGTGKSMLNKMAKAR